MSMPRAPQLGHRRAPQATGRPQTPHGCLRSAERSMNAGTSRREKSAAVLGGHSSGPVLCPSFGTTATGLPNIVSKMRLPAGVRISACTSARKTGFSRAMIAIAHQRRPNLITHAVQTPECRSRRRELARKHGRRRSDWVQSSGAAPFVITFDQELGKDYPGRRAPPLSSP